MRAVHVEPPAELGTRDGLAYALFLPQRDAGGGVVILHGAGSCKESHFDFARSLRAAGLAAVVFDQRGHGESEGALGAGALDDVATMAGLLMPGPVALRGSSMGGFMAIQAAATADQIAGAIAICPAGANHLLRGLRSGTLEMRIDPDAARALEAWLAEHDLRQAVELMGSKPLLLIHASGDDQIPSDWSQQLYARAREPRKLILLPGGHHRSAQHDAELHGVALRWLERNLGAGP
jgi:alpha-beta hydrolase superfamily lysophospholipase